MADYQQHAALNSCMVPHDAYGYVQLEGGSVVKVPCHRSHVWGACCSALKIGAAVGLCALVWAGVLSPSVSHARGHIAGTNQISVDNLAITIRDGMDRCVQQLGFLTRLRLDGFQHRIRPVTLHRRQTGTRRYQRSANQAVGQGNGQSELVYPPDQSDQVDQNRFEAASQLGNPSLGAFSRLWLGQSEIPVASYKPSDVKELFGGALFLVLQRFQEQRGNAYLLPTGPSSSFLVLSDPVAAKYVLCSYKTYEKGLVRELSQFLFGDGFAVADGEAWKVRRRAVAPSLHQKFLNAMVNNFVHSSLRTVDVLASRPQRTINMEKIFSELTLDIIGKAVFNYDFMSVGLDGDNPVVEAVYTALKEIETRALDLAPLWKLPGDLPTKISPRQKRAADAVALIRKTTEDLIENCRLQVEAEEAARTASQADDNEYVSDADPSVLRFLIASREEVKSSQLRDDLLSMLVAGHETTASVLTWTLYLLTKHPDKMTKVQEEIDAELGTKIEAGNLTLDDIHGISYLRWSVFESMRLYPHPPVLIRRALRDDILPNGWKVHKGQDVMISVYNIHHSTSFWSQPEEFLPERWYKYSRPMDVPSEKNTDYRYIPFSGGARRCVGDKFALLEAYMIMAVLLYKFDFQLVEGQDIGMTTGATIHTTNGMMMHYTPRQVASTGKFMRETRDQHANAVSGDAASAAVGVSASSADVAAARVVVATAPAQEFVSIPAAASSSGDTNLAKNSLEKVSAQDDFFKVVNGTKYVRKILERLEEDAKDGEISHAEAKKALHDIQKAPDEYGLMSSKFTANMPGKGISEHVAPVLDHQQKEDAYASFNPLEKFIFWRFSLSVARELGEVNVQPASNYSGLIAQVNRVARSSNLTSIQTKAQSALVRLFPKWLLPSYRVLFGPFGEFSTWIIAWMTRFSSQWLMGPSELADLERKDGTIGKGLLLKIEKCRFLEGSGPCVKTCLHACKVPTQNFFMQEMGIPVTLKPNMTSLGCEMLFGEVPPPLDKDPVTMTPCFATCQMKSRHNAWPCD